MVVKIERENEFEKILESKGLKIEDKSFINNLFDVRKRLIAGKNASGKTRLLKSIEDYFDYENNHDAQPYLIVSMFLPDINLDYKVDESVSSNDDSLFLGIVLAMLKERKKIKIDIPSIMAFLEEMKVPNIGYPMILEEINKNLYEYSEKKLSQNATEQTIMINRFDHEDTPFFKEWQYLSHGEKVIIFSSVLITYFERMRTSLEQKSVIVLIDEPELHLHTEVMLRMIKKLASFFNDNNKPWYLFIATQSIFLVPLFRFEEQVYMHKNIISKKNSMINKKLYEDLLGTGDVKSDDDRNLFDFIASVDFWVYTGFLSECFKPPTQSSEVLTDDPQFMALQEEINKMITEQGSVTILDYGCGEEARIGQCLGQSLNNLDSDITQKIKYYLYDSYNIDKNIVNVKTITCLKDMITSFKKLEEMPETFDIITLFNVLHEIDVREWKKNLNIIIKALKQNGILIFSERYTLAKGEKPYGDSGYLVLGKQEVNLLFSNQEPQKVEDPDNNKIIKNALRKKYIINEVTGINIEKSLEELVKNSEEKIDSVINKKATISSRNYAFYCQQLINAKHALKLLYTCKYEPPGSSNCEECLKSDGCYLYPPNEIAHYKTDALVEDIPVEKKKVCVRYLKNKIKS